MSEAERADELNAPPKTASVAVWLQLLLIPLCLLAAIFLPIDATLPQRGKLAFLAWTLLTSGSTIAAGVSGDVRVIFRFVLGPVQYRKPWMIAQVCAWLGTMAFVAGTAWFLYSYRRKVLTDAIGFAAICAIPAAIGSYLLALGFMPLPFFEDDWIGKRVYGFFGVKSLHRAPWACRLAFVGLFAISIFLLYVNDRVFGTEGLRIPAPRHRAAVEGPQAGDSLLSGSDG